MRMIRPLTTIALCAVAGCSPISSYCDPLMATSELDATLRVIVPSGQADKFNQRVVAFLTEKGFSHESSASDGYLGPPDAGGRQTAFRNIKTIGCTSKTVIWSENVTRADEFIITFHHTTFGDRGSTVRLMSELAEAVRSTRSR